MIKLIFSACLCLSIQAQTLTITGGTRVAVPRVEEEGGEPILAKIHYNFKHLNDTTNKAQFLKDETVTYLSKATSYYTTYSSSKVSEEVARQVADPTFDGNITITKAVTGIKTFYYLEPNEQDLKAVHQVGINEFLSEEEFPVQDWKLTDERKTIGGYDCQKAEATFKGRTYTAWFTTEIPFPYGPWKLNGLPGLILEAHDTNNEVVFEYAGFDLIDSLNLRMGIPKLAKIGKIGDIKKAEAAFESNRQAAINSGSSAVKLAIIRGIKPNNASSESMSKIKSINVKADENYKPSKTTNNPIELTQ